MLLEFTVSNYKSFKDKMTFSLIPAPKQKGLNYSILKTKVGKTVYKALSSSVIYGPNAAGKTSIISAMDTFKKIMLRGNIKDSESNDTPNYAAYKLALIPNLEMSKKSKNSPVEFYIKFVEDSKLFEYSFSADFGAFLQNDPKRKILEESLCINKEILYKRSSEDDLEFAPITVFKKYGIDFDEERYAVICDMAKENLNNEEFFLNYGFKTMISPKITELVTDWLNNKFLTVCSSHSMLVTPHFQKDDQKKTYFSKTLDSVTKYFGANGAKLAYRVEDNSPVPMLCSIVESKDGIKGIPADSFESLGTIRFTNLLPLILTALSIGGILIIDEFDGSLHPMALMSIINAFHNDEINVHNAQLVFNTHNPILLNKNLFRRDEIKFVERNDKTHFSELYSLSDFGTSGSNGVRQTSDYMKNYFMDKYGALKSIDFTPMFEELLNTEKVNGIDDKKK